MKTLVHHFLGNESGATAIEYGLIAVFIAFGIIGGMTSVGTGINTLFKNLATSIN